MKIKITVRDGRFGRDPKLVTDEGGEVLATFEVDRPFDEGDVVTLPKGDRVQVIGLEETFDATSYEQTLFVGDLF